ncbi:MAG: virulence factor SrfC family protein [Bilophila sp.]
MTDDSSLVARCGRLVELVRDASAWAVENQDVVRGEFDGLQRDLRRVGRVFRTCEAAARRKMCAGVFGPSQAGKSYLISALARDVQGTLLADFGGETHDFISEINPEGGKESTGLVTRFTTTKPADAPKGYPVMIRLLTEMDLVKILANTYYADCEHRETPDPAPVAAMLDRLEKKAGAPNATAPDLDEFEELREYLEKDFRAKPRVQELERCFWTRALAIGSNLALGDRIRLYSLIWDETEPFTRLLELLLGALEHLGFAGEAFAPLASLIPRSGSIIDVATLQGLGTQGNSATGSETLEVATAAGARAQLPRAVVTALTAELTISMREKPDDLFDHTDLLDFPGYRSRYKIEDLRRELDKPDMLRELFLRGKVAYLFQRYSAERELTSMLLCVGPSNQEVQDLPGVINDWVLSTHGETPERRRGTSPSLYFVLTKFDMEFEQKKGAPSVESRWDTRLHVSLLDFFGKQHDWPRIWDGVHGFNNLFLLRNPNFRFDAILNYDADGQELSIRPDQQSYVNALEAAFCNSKLVAEHFENPREAWDAAMLLNDGGIGLIRNKLRPLCNPEIKRQQIRTTLLERQERLVARLKPFWKADDREEERKRKALLFRQLATRLAGMAETQHFGAFLHLLGVQDHDLYELYFEAERRMLQSAASGTADNGQANDFPNRSLGSGVTVGAKVNADDILSDLFGAEPLPELETPVETTPKRCDEAQYFAALIESHWFGALHKLADNVEIQQYYSVPAQEFAAFVSELALGAERVGLRLCIEEQLRKAAGYANLERERLIWKQVSLAASLINAYVSWLGFNPRTRTLQERTIHQGGRSVVLFEPPAPIQGYPQLAEEPEAHEKTWYTDWLRALMTLIMDNVDFDGTQAVNPEQNRRLGDVIRDLSIPPTVGS